MGDIIVITVLGVIVVSAICSMRKNHKNGGACSGCSGNCSGKCNRFTK